MNLSEAILHALARRGATEVFGIPGDFVLPFFDVLDRSGILPYYTFSHEPAVGFAADAAARYRGGVGVAAVTYGAGALNLVNAVAGAYAEKSPVVVISGAPGMAERQGSLLLHHQAKSLASQDRIFEEVTCDHAVLDDPADAPTVIARVLDNCLSQSRPVYLEIPRDLATAPLEPVPEPASSRHPDMDAVHACAEEIISRLDAAERPLILAGVEVRRYGLEDQVAQLANHLGVPVVTTLLGRGLFAGRDCPLQGTYLGTAGDPKIRHLVEDSADLLMLGVIHCDTNFGTSVGRIDTRSIVDASEGRVHLGFHDYPDIPLRDLLEALLALTRPPATVTLQHAAVCARPLTADDADVTPDDVAAAINHHLPVTGRMPIVADMGDALFLAGAMNHTALVAPAYYASMGFAVPAGLGIQAATGDRPLILLGDGAFQMTGWELGHCARYGWDPVVVVLNNGGWGTLAAFRPDAHYNGLGTWPLARIGRALGGDAHRVRTRRELVSALDQAFSARGRFQLVEVMLPTGSISSVLERFVAAMSQRSAALAD